MEEIQLLYLTLLFFLLGGYSDFLYNFLFVKKSTEENVKTEPEADVIKVEVEKPVEPYELKYLNDIRKLDSQWDITIDPYELQTALAEKTQSLQDDIEQLISEFQDKYELETEDMNAITSGTDIENNTAFALLKQKSQYKFVFEVDYKKLTAEITKIREILDDIDGKLTEIVTEEIRDGLIKERLAKLKDSYIIEYTPNGNVLMIYNMETGTFDYYSDLVMPYKYLEVVGRRYVKMFGCRPVFVDMEEELKLAEERWELEQKNLQEKEAIEKLEKAEKGAMVVKKKSDIFGKFKSYNKDGKSGRVNFAPPPKTSIPNNSVTNERKENEKVLLKEKANRYVYKGKFYNFNFLKKIDRKKVVKKYAMSFADFKRMGMGACASVDPQKKIENFFDFFEYPLKH